MKRKLKWLLYVSVALFALLGIWGYWAFRGGRSYSTDLNQLRAQFNQDKGKVRIVMLLSPT